MSTRLLVPVDGSEPALRAVQLAGTLARALGAKLTLLHVADAHPAPGRGGATAAEVETARRQVEEATFARAEAELAGVHVERRRELGEPGECIVAVASAGGFDHVVMGSRGLSRVKGLLLGSVSERVARRASCAVTLVR